MIFFPVNVHPFSIRYLLMFSEILEQKHAQNKKILGALNFFCQNLSLDDEKMSIILNKRKHFLNNSKNINHLSFLNLLISFLLLFIAVLTLFYNSNTPGFSTFGLSG